MSERLPELLDCKALQAELGVTRAVAEKVMRQLPVVTFPGIRKVYVARADVRSYIERCTSGGEWRFVKTEVSAGAGGSVEQPTAPAGGSVVIVEQPHRRTP